MANPLMSNVNPGGISVGKFIQFMNTFKGDPKQQVMKLLESGQMSREQFEQLKAQATELEKLFKS